MSMVRTVVTKTLCGLCAIYRAGRPAAGLRVLMYHAVGSRIPSDVQGRYTLAPERFFAQMRHLKKSGQSIVPLRAPDSCTEVAVTFDDGYRDNFTDAYPVLSELGIPFTIFVTSDFIRSGNPLYLQPSELRTLANDPLVTIGAHGKSHTPLSKVPPNALSFELRDSRAFLEDLTGHPVKSMSYPHGATNARIRDAVAEAGFDLAAGSRFGWNHTGADLLSLRRTDVWNSDDLSVFEQKLSGGWDWLAYIGSNSRDEHDD